jgi:hypothetical protein
MRIPLYLAVAQWALLLALGLLVVTAYRQLARVLGQASTPAELGPPVGSHPSRIVYQPLPVPGSAGPASPGSASPASASPASAGQDSAGQGNAGGGPSAGARAEPTGLAQLEAMLADAADAVRVFTPGHGQPALIAFVDPTCPSCEQLVATLSAAAAAGELAGLRVLLLTSDPPAYLQISPAFQAAGLEIGRAVDRGDLESYRPSATPLLVAIDAGGAVTKAGTALRAAEVRAFRLSCLVPAPSPEALLPVTT